MEEIPKNRTSKNDHRHGINSQRMFKLNEILNIYPIKNSGYSVKKNLAESQLALKRLNTPRFAYKIAIKVGFISGLLVGGFMGIIFLIITR